jgi:hypothetical protein
MNIRFLHGNSGKGKRYGSTKAVYIEHSTRYKKMFVIDVYLSKILNNMLLFNMLKYLFVPNVLMHEMRHKLKMITRIHISFCVL